MALSTLVTVLLNFGRSANLVLSTPLARSAFMVLSKPLAFDALQWLIMHVPYFFLERNPRGG
jgi:hypothetical protein